MESKTSYTKDEYEQIKFLFRKKMKVQGVRKNPIRGKIRKLGFLISDFSTDGEFDAIDFDNLFKSGRLSIKENK